MKDSQFQFIEIGRLRVGMFVHLDVGWMEHPFPFNRFKIRSEQQIEAIRALGLARVRCIPERSDREALAGTEPAPTPAPTSAPTSAPIGTASTEDAPEAGQVPDEAASGESVAGTSPERAARQADRALLADQIERLERCERRFHDARRCYRSVLSNVPGQPAKAREIAEQVVDGMLAEMGAAGEVAIRLLSEKAGEGSSLHPVNCTVLALLLGKACGLGGESLREIGTGALLHDIGKLELPARLHWRDGNFTQAERRMYEDHVPKGLVLAERMALPEGVRRIIGEHHEMDDGSGHPAGLRGADMSPGARVVALVNQYDNLCNPGNPMQALTPHEALAVMFARMRGRFDATTMSMFIRMMGVYPPGSVIELSDGRYALSVSVNASRPLRPQVVVHDPAVPVDEALLVDLERLPELGVRRCLKPTQLPRAVMDYLSPRKRICYYFERSLEVVPERSPKS